MRTLSPEEKSFVSELVRIAKISHNVFLGNVVDRELNNTDVYLDYANNQVEYRFDENLYHQNPNQFMDFAREFSWRMMRYINLLRDLEKEGMLFLLQESPNVNNSRFGKLVRGNSFIGSSVNDPEAISSFLKYSKKTILINQSLYDFEENDFKTEADLKHIESIEYSRKNLKVADESLQSSLKSLDIASKSLEAGNEGLRYSRENLEVANKSFNSSLESLDLASKSFESGNKSLDYSRYTLITTIIIFIIGTIINLYVSNKEQQPFKIDEQQLSQINNSFKTSNQTLQLKVDTLKDRFSQIDSLVDGIQNEVNSIEKSMGSSNKTLSMQIKSIEKELTLMNKTINSLSKETE